MSEMIDRVAKAVWGELEKQGATKAYDINSLRFDGVCNPVEIARAAIAAMREPTEAMLEAARSAADRAGWLDECRGEGIERQVRAVPLES